MRDIGVSLYRMLHNYYKYKQKHLVQTGNVNKIRGVKKKLDKVKYTKFNLCKY